MKRKSVESSNIKTIGYDGSTATLEIEFLSGFIYKYYEVNEQIYMDLMQASSHGSYFNLHIKNRYTYKKLA